MQSNLIEKSDRAQIVRAVNAHAALALCAAALAHAALLADDGGEEWAAHAAAQAAADAAAELARCAIRASRIGDDLAAISAACSAENLRDLVADCLAAA